MNRRKDLEKLLAERILVLDGAMGTLIQSYGLDEQAFRGKRFADHARDVKGCNDLLSLTRPDVIEQIHGQYLAAGADCVFVPGGLSRETIGTLARELDGPLNVVANPAISVPIVPDVPELARLGVRRVSVGSGAMRATLALTQRIAKDFSALSQSFFCRQP